MLNVRVNANGIVTTAESPTMPSKINDTDVILTIDDPELEKVIFNNIPNIKLNIYTLEYEILPKIPTREEINNQIVAKIRQKYSIDDEFQMQRLGMQDNENPEYQAYLTYVNECITWGQQEKEKYGLL